MTNLPRRLLLTESFIDRKPTLFSAVQIKNVLWGTNSQNIVPEGRRQLVEVELVEPLSVGVYRIIADLEQAWTLIWGGVGRLRPYLTSEPGQIARKFCASHPAGFQRPPLGALSV